jgi:O-antigen ligase
VINAFNYTSSTTSIAVNPHSLYLLLTFNFGLVGLFIFLIMVGVPLVRLLTQYIKSPEKRLYIRSIATPLVVFLTLGLSNDTIIGTGVILYLLIGVLYARTEDEKEVLMD